LAEKAAQLENLNSVDSCREFYRDTMRKYVASSKYLLKQKVLHAEHFKLKEDAKDLLRGKLILSHEDDSKPFIYTLEQVQIIFESTPRYVAKRHTFRGPSYHFSNSKWTQSLYCLNPKSRCIYFASSVYEKAHLAGARR
jgi:hypothetical protein